MAEDNYDGPYMTYYFDKVRLVLGCFGLGLICFPDSCGGLYSLLVLFVRGWALLLLVVSLLCR
jgi:hypothetical protein